MRTSFFALLFVGLLAGGVSLGDEPAGCPARDMAEQALANLRQACLNADKDAFMACFDTTPDAERLLIAVFDVGAAMQTFRNSLAKAYGEEAAEQFVEDMPDVLARLACMTTGDVTYGEDCDTATCTSAEHDTPLDLVRIDCLWYVVLPEDEVPTGEELDYAVAFMGRIADAVDGVAELIGADGVTIDLVKQELDEAMLEASAAASADRAAARQAAQEAAPEPEQGAAREDEQEAGQAAPCYRPADTPQQAVENLRQACLNPDKEIFIACFSGLADGERIASAVFDLGVAAQAFRNSIAEAYGEEAVRRFRRGAPDVLNDLADMTTGDVTLGADGNTATCTAPNEQPLDLVRVNRLWYVVMPEFEGFTPQELDMIAVFFGHVADAVDSVEELIAADGVTIDRVEQELDQAMTEALAAASAEYAAAQAAARQAELEAGQGEPEAPSYPVADTPQQAVENLRQAFLAGDKDAFLACSSTTPSVESILSLAFDFELAVREFRSKLVEAYGEEAAAEFAGPARMVDEFEEVSTDDMTFDVDGDTAVATIEADEGTGERADGRQPEPTELIRIDGVWYIVVSEEGVPTGDHLDRTLAVMTVRPGVVADVAERIGDDGMTIEQLEKDLETELSQAATAALMEKLVPTDIEDPLRTRIIEEMTRQGDLQEEGAAGEDDE